jgi:hypothetical protein
VQLGTGAVQGVRRPSKVSELQPEQSIERLLLQVCTESKEVQHLEVFEGLPQGVRARVFLKDSKS